MGKQLRRIIWDERALRNFIEILDYIKKNSPTNAKRVKTRISNLIKAIPTNPKVYRNDELKKGNDGSFRVFHRDSIRVSYKIEPTNIIIARVRHSSQEPTPY
jgi:plasmid stabilization system protein ParE